jgi:hypothetical protein
LPHIDLLTQAMRIPPERLDGRAKIAIDAPLLRLILQSLVSLMPFSEAFYRESYADLAAAAATGRIADLHRHFVETGYFEGRLGAPPDVHEAVARGDMASAREHYLRAGAAEGRVPSPDQAREVDAWMRLLKVTLLPEA